MKKIHQGMTKHPGTSNSGDPILTLGQREKRRGGLGRGGGEGGEEKRDMNCSCRIDRGCGLHTATANQ